MLTVSHPSFGTFVAMPVPGLAKSSRFSGSSTLMSTEYATVMAEADARGQQTMAAIEALLQRTLSLIAPALVGKVGLKVSPLFQPDPKGTLVMTHEVMAVPASDSARLPFRLLGLGTLPNEFVTHDAAGKRQQRCLSRNPSEITPTEFRPFLEPSVAELQRRMAPVNPVKPSHPKTKRAKGLRVLKLTVLHPPTMFKAMFNRAIRRRKPGKAA